MADRFDVVVIGGGPAGSVAGRCIAAAGFSVGLLEGRRFPREAVCGEFLSPEVLETIHGLGLEGAFRALCPNPLRTFTLAGNGAEIRVPLGFTAYGVRRGKFDALLLAAAVAGGVNVLQPAEATGIERNREGYTIRYREGRRDRELQCAWVVGAYGRSSPLDRALGRSFVGARTGFTGVKFHVPAEAVENLRPEEIMIALGEGIYCGVSHVGDGAATICYLERRTNGIPSSRERIWELARRNYNFARVVTPATRKILQKARVYGTGNIFFGTRRVVEDGVLMVGDAAGLIAPLAGDGIGIAMEQARLLGDLFAGMQGGKGERNALAERYKRESSKLLASRRRVALLCQQAALSKMLRPMIGPLVTLVPGLLRAAIRSTRGNATARN